MSTALGIASVTAVLKNLLDDGMVDDTIVNSVGNVKISTIAPDLIALSGDAPSQVNLFLYQLMPNAGWRNAGLPSRDGRGDRRTNPPLAIDLHYLLTAYAGKDLHAEILLGHAMQILHETPGLSRDAIRRGLGDPGLNVDPTNLLPAGLRALASSELAEQVETIKVVPHATGPEDIPKLWTALQSKFRPSVAYHVSVVLIESKRPTRVAPPVRTPKLYVETMRAPRIDRVLSQEVAGGPILEGAPILAGHRLVLRGTQLRGDRTLVRIGPTTSPVTDGSLEDSQIVLPIPAAVPAGVQSAQVVHERLLGIDVPPLPHNGVVSNLAAFVLRPNVRAVSMPAPGTLRLDIEPPLVPAQRAVVLLNRLVPVAAGDTPPQGYSFAVPAQAFGSPPGPLPQLDVPIPGVPSGSYLVRLQVEGADSPVYADAQGRYDRPAVTVP